MRAVLTDVSVRALKAPARGQATIWDKHSPIGVRVSAGGAKTYIVMIGSGKRRMIGKVGIIKLSEARDDLQYLPQGWGWHSKWVFRKKWNAQDAIASEDMQTFCNTKIVLCVIEYHLPSR